MDATEYFEEKNRMTKGCKSCKDCSFNQSEMTCGLFEQTYPEKAIEIMENWIEENPKKTYFTELLNKFPNARMGDEKVPTICPSDIGFKDFPDCGMNNCSCCTECWNQEMK